GKRPNCGDHSGPTSRFLSNLRKAATRKGKGLVLRGTSKYQRCKNGAKGKVKRVVIQLKLQVTKKKCRYLTRTGRLGRTARCSKAPAFVTAKGTSKWRYAIKGPLPTGKYIAYVLAKDDLGNTERRSAHRNFRHFRIRGGAVLAGWHGRQSPKVPPPGHKD
ncbi:MAG TPA: hypothetical protein VF066_18465, partial [Thermoleophilaceae bacterium]